MKKNILEQLIDTNPQAEIWWDSSPLIYENWARKTVEKAPPEKKERWQEQLTRLFNPQDKANSFFRGVTTNPPLSLAVFKDDPKTWQNVVQSLMQDHPQKGVEEIYWLTYKEVVKRGAQAFLPLWEKSGYRYGYISAQVDPRNIFQEDKMYSQAIELADISPNIMIKVPGSKEGYKVITRLTGLGIATNNTLSMTIPQFLACIQAVEEGLQEAKARGKSLSRWRSVITHMSARYGTLGDLESQAQARGIQLTEEDVRWAELAIFKKAYRMIQENKHPTKMLMCSMRMGPPAADGSATSWHIEKIAGSDVVYTCPPPYIASLMQAEEEMKPFDSQAIHEPPPEDTLERLLSIPYFAKAYQDDGMKKEEFNTLGSLVETAAQFSRATREMVDFIAREFQRIHPEKDRF